MKSEYAIDLEASRPRAARTRNGGTWTEAQFYSAIRSALRAKFKWWKPAMVAMRAAERPYHGPNKLQKKEYLCAFCGKWHKQKNIHKEHVIPCGSLRCMDDIVPFIQRLTIEDAAGFQIVCKQCHQRKTNEEMQARRDHRAAKKVL